MPPRTRITKEMVADAALAVIRSQGWESLSARAVSRQLGCSTQPVMWHFKTVGEMKKAAYDKADQFHSESLLDIRGDSPMKDIGLNYIRFAAREKNLFRFLFQSDSLAGKSFCQLMDSAELLPIASLLCQEAQLDLPQAKEAFQILFLYVHGYASMLANNAMPYDEAEAARQLDALWEGAVYAARKGREDHAENG